MNDGSGVKGDGTFGVIVRGKVHKKRDTEQTEKESRTRARRTTGMGRMSERDGTREHREHAGGNVE